MGKNPLVFRNDIPFLLGEITIFPWLFPWLSHGFSRGFSHGFSRGFSPLEPPPVHRPVAALRADLSLRHARGGARLDDRVEMHFFGGRAGHHGERY